MLKYVDKIDIISYWIENNDLLIYREIFEYVLNIMNLVKCF